jgi:G:T/U-mismatch repair DNA glycosylase
VKTVAAVSTGWALKQWFKGVKSFCLSDHADYRQLLEYVDLTRARKVYTTHGFAKEFACDLRKMGVEAVSLDEMVPPREARGRPVQRKLD